MTAAVAGCIGGDEEPVANGNGDGNDEQVNGNVTNGNNVTQEPPPTPVADIGVQMAVDGSSPADPPFIAPNGADVTFTLDGSGSTVEEGSIDTYSWSVLRPDGSEEQATTGSNPTYELMINGTSNPGSFGVYTATLRVMSDQFQLGTTSVQFVLSYNTTYTFEHMMIGPALQDCADPQIEGEGAIEGIVLGTYRTHGITLGANATSLDLNLDFTTEDPLTEMKIYLYGDGTEIEATNCGDAIAESDAGDGSVSLSVDDLGITSKSSFSIRVQMIGLSISGYTMSADVTYAIPGGAGADDGGDDEGDNGDE